MEEWYLLIILGFAIGLIAVTGGFGGGVFLVPFFVIILGVEIPDARVVSFFMILINSLIGTFIYLKQNRIHVKLGLIAATCTISGSLLFNIFLSDLSSQVVRIIFGGFMSIISIYFILQFIFYYRKRMNVESTVDKSIGVIPKLEGKNQFLKAIPIFLLGGFISALTGTGGGYINVPTVNLIFNFPIHFATAMSTFIMLFTSGFNVIYNIFLGKGYLFLEYGIYVVIGSVIGSRIGAKLSSKIPKHVLKGVVGTILILVGVNMILNNS